MANAANLGDHFGVGDVGAVPSEQKVHAMSGSQSNVEGILRRLYRYRAGIKKMPSKLSDIIPQIKERKRLERLETSRRELGVSQSCLVQNELRDEDAEMSKSAVPPLPRRRLMSCDDNVAAWACRVVAGNSGLHVNRWLHFVANNNADESLAANRLVSASDTEK